MYINLILGLHHKIPKNKLIIVYKFLTNGNIIFETFHKQRRKIDKE